MNKSKFLALIAPVFALGMLMQIADAAPGNVYVSRFWHNHQPIYWPEWNGNGSQTSRVQYAWDSIVMKPGQNYGGLSPAQHPENNLTEIFGNDDRRNAYQSGPKNSLASFNSSGGFAISYSGSLIDNVRQLGGYGQLGYGGGWNNGYKEARNWKTPAGATRMDLVGFTYHHSLAPLLPKSVFRKELQIFKQAWWKAWGGKSDLSDHSKGYFPTEMAYSRHLIDVLVDEGYQWVIVPSHHISRTSPSYNTKANPEGSYNIFSSPPNKADQIGPTVTEGWWYSEPNPGNAAWNVAPMAYQLHKVKYVNPETGAEKSMVAVPSDDVLSYRFGYANEGVGKIDTFIAPHANDPNRPLMVMPSTDGDNAWGGGSSSWHEATPQFFNESASRGYKPSTPQDFVNAFGANAPMAHIEDGAWIFPEMDYGSPNFMKWIEPPVAKPANRGVTTVPGTQIDMETPGFALKFYSYAPLMAGANWCETAEQILKDEGGSVSPWKVQAPYDWDGSWQSPNPVELAWHIYLVGLDSGFNYYGGLGNDDEMKPGLATRRAVEKLEPWINANNRRSQDRTGPTVLKPQRFPYNPGGYTFGWFNVQPHIPNNAFLKRMNSDFYVWTHAYDLSGIPAGNVKLKVRIDGDGVNPLNSNQNETFAGGSEVGQWQTFAMTKKELPKTRAALNAAADNGQIDYFLPVQDYAVADYYFFHITDEALPGFRNKLLDYYIEATDSKGNVTKSEIQHVWVGDYSGQTNGSGGGGGGGGGGTAVTLNPTNAVAGQSLTVTYKGSLAGGSTVNIHHGYNGANWTAVPGVPMTKSGTNWTYTYTVPAQATTLAMAFNDGNNNWDNNGGGNFNFTVATNPITEAPAQPTGLTATASSSTVVNVAWTAAARATSYKVFRNNTLIATISDTSYADSGRLPSTTYSYKVIASNSIGDSAASATVSATTPAAPLDSKALEITNPLLPVEVDGATYTIQGRAGSAFTNGLTWTNAAAGQGGTITFPGGNVTNGWSWSASVPLSMGSNNIVVAGNYPEATNTVVSDSPNNYSAWWVEGEGANEGFGQWYNDSSTNNAGLFLASGQGNLNVGSTKGFGLWANGSGKSEATRAFVTPLAVGDKFSVKFDNNWIESGKEVGFKLADSDGVIRFKFYFVGGEQTYRIDDATMGRDTGVAYTADGMTLELTVTGANSYSFKTGANTITGTFKAGEAISWVKFYNQGTGSGTDYNLYIGEMTHTKQGSGSGSKTANASIVRVGAGEITDGLPNSWWQTYFPNQADWVASHDADGDGYTNAQEFALGTNPTDAKSRFEVRNTQKAGDGTVTITWASKVGNKYHVQARAALERGAWEDVGSEITATGETSSAVMQDAGSKHFYRVRLVP